MQLIKNKALNVEHNEEIIYSSYSLDYLITYNADNGITYCYGNRKLDLTHFLIPGITSKISAETGEFLLTSTIFKNIVSLFNIESDKIYFILRVVDNSKPSDEIRQTVFVFADKEDCISFNSILIGISLKYKNDYLSLKR